MKIHFAYYNRYKNGIDIAFADNTLLFLSCAEAEKNLHTTLNSQRLIDNLAIDEPLKYATLALDGELQAWLMLWMRIGIRNILQLFDIFFNSHHHIIMLNMICIFKNLFKYFLRSF